jgi:hypothetical protein
MPRAGDATGEAASQPQWRAEPPVFTTTGFVPLGKTVPQPKADTQGQLQKGCFPVWREATAV